MKPWRSPKLLKSAKDQSCIRCGRNDGTVCARHYNGLWQGAYGKGRGQKCSDLLSADFCSQCDQIFSEGNFDAWKDVPTEWQSDVKAVDFMHWIAMTNLRRLERGILGVK